MTPILSEMYMHIKETHPEYLCQETKATKQMEDIIQEALPENIRINVMNMIYSYTNEYKDIGFINGFRICLRVIRELQNAECEDFMNEILTDTFNL